MSDIQVSKQRHFKAISYFDILTIVRLCIAICVGLKRQMKAEENGTKTLLTLGSLAAVGEAPEEEDLSMWIQEACGEVTGRALSPGIVRQARMKEIGYVEDKEVWVKVARYIAMANVWSCAKSAC